jgi:hypothetical protein
VGVFVAVLGALVGVAVTVAEGAETTLTESKVAVLRAPLL